MSVASEETEVVAAFDEQAGLERARAALAEGQFDVAKVHTDEVLLACPTSWEAHFLAGKVAVAAKDYDAAVWHAFMTLAYVPEQSFSERVLAEIIDPMEGEVQGSVTKHLLHGLVAGMDGKLDQALQEFRQSLAKAEAREDRIRALQFLVLVTGEMGSNEASLGYADELIKSDPDNYLARLWRSDLLYEMQRYEEASAERDEAHRLLEAFEDAARMELGHAVSTFEKPEVLTKGNLRKWLTHSTSPHLAPMRAMLLAYPGKSNLWLSLVDQLFSFDDIFGSSNSLLDAQLLEQIVAEAVVAKRVKESIPLPHPMRNPFGAEDAEMAVSVVVQKASFALASFALLTLFV
jgi:tetratricopeptide (TPR) repeat protein